MSEGKTLLDELYEENSLINEEIDIINGNKEKLDYAIEKMVNYFEKLPGLNIKMNHGHDTTQIISWDKNESIKDFYMFGSLVEITGQDQDPKRISRIKDELRFHSNDEIRADIALSAIFKDFEVANTLVVNSIMFKSTIFGNFLYYTRAIKADIFSSPGKKIYSKEKDSLFLAKNKIQFDPMLFSDNEIESAFRFLLNKEDYIYLNESRITSGGDNKKESHGFLWYILMYVIFYISFAVIFLLAENVLNAKGLTGYAALPALALCAYFYYRQKTKK